MRRRSTPIASRSAIARIASNGPPLPELYTRRDRNGRPRLQNFCLECGSPLFTTGEGEDAGWTGIRVATIDQRRELRPSRLIRCHPALPWVNDIEQMPDVDQDG